MIWRVNDTGLTDKVTVRQNFGDRVLVSNVMIMKGNWLG